LFEILDIAGTRTGEFVGLGEGARVGNFGTNLFITYAAGDGNDVALYTVASIAGDFDQDGDADGADFLKWQSAFGSTDSMADGNDDGVVDGNDLAIWASHFGEEAMAGTGDAVPEPLAACVMAIGLVVRCVGSRRRSLAR
jgi:hypothetical protein